ncbi:MAG: fumarate hydratase [Tissierellia bacterium]|jgi:fumarate hydratase subunit alpha|nr:fumarate hydratase [Tissierellia bacterium]
MKTIHVDKITEEVKRMAIEAAYFLPDDVQKSLEDSREKDDWPLAKEILDQILANAEIARTEEVPMCQDTGMAVVFVEMGQDVHVEGGYIEDAINEGVRQGYEEGYLRKSVVGDPIERVNTKDNTPAVINYKIVPGDELKITFAAKGFGSENMSRLTMLKPADGLEGVKKFILETVELAGPNPCPPIVVGVGVGGTFDKAAAMAKEVLMRPLDEYHENKFYADLERELEEKVANLGVGPQGFGGRTTALRVMIKEYPTHIAGLPVAVNINCHATRHKEVIL